MTAAQECSGEEFLAEADEILDALAEGLLRLEASASEGDPDPESVNSIFRSAHSLKGISGMCGFAQVTEVAHQTETLLDAVRMGRIPCSREVLDLLFDSLDLLKGLCARWGSGDSDDDPRTRPLVSRLVAVAEGPSSASGPGIEALGLPEETRRVLTEYEVHRVEETLKSPKRSLLRVRVAFPMESFETGLEDLNEALSDCGEIISTLPTPGASGDDRLEFEILLGAKVELSRVEAAARRHDARVERLGEADGAAEPLAGQRMCPDAPSAHQEPAVETPGPGAPPPPPLKSSAVAQEHGELRSLAKSIRVELPKLDALMNLVADLVLTKGRIQILAERLREQMGFAGEALEMAKAHKELERRLSELQQAVMDVRMVPLGQVFSKLHRVMRKILHGCSKDADLEISGADTELDKLIVEDLGDSLIHVIRNAVDHGIEEPQERMSRGKPARGKVRISARQRGNHVVIEVSDDGAGLSRERIREKAAERGLIAEDAVLEDRELFDLLFLPGFSTRDQVTEISGRGVGMDVLRKNIAHLSGMIELSSEEGKGTTVTIILPITLAIIQALLVEAGGQSYAVPLNSVLETLTLEAGQVKALEGRPVLRLRDQTLPLARLDRLFELRAGNEMPSHAVVVGAAERKAAFAVNSLVSQREVVIKGLGPRLQGLKGIAGATVLGDQRTVLVLDVPALVQEVFAGN